MMMTVKLLTVER